MTARAEGCGATPVLLGDPDPDYRSLIRLALEGSEVIELVGDTGDGLELVELAHRLHPQAVVLEVELASLDGFGVVSRLRHAGFEGAAVMLSGYRADDLDLGPRGSAAGLGPANSCYQPPVADVAGPIGYLPKRTPVTRLAHDLAELVSLLRRLHPEAAAAVALDATAEAPRQARRFVARQLAEWGQLEVEEVVTLLVSELASNATTHAGGGAAGEHGFEVRLVMSAGSIRAEVFDPFGTVPIRRRAGEAEPGGRGLDIVEALSSSWGVSVCPTGKCVWFEVARPVGGGGP